MNNNSFLRIGGVVLAALAIAGVVYFFIQPKPLPPRSDEPYVNPEIAEVYQAVNDAAAADPASAEAVARRLEELDPENGMTYYAIAAAGGRRGDERGRHGGHRGRPGVAPRHPDVHLTAARAALPPACAWDAARCRCASWAGAAMAPRSPPPR
jgi:hypothetical protein